MSHWQTTYFAYFDRQAVRIDLSRMPKIVGGIVMEKIKGTQIQQISLDFAAKRGNEQMNKNKDIKTLRKMTSRTAARLYTGNTATSKTLEQART